MSLGNFLRTGSYLDLEYIYGELTNSNGEDPLDYETIQEAFRLGRRAEVVATDARTGLPVYFDYASMAKDDYGAIKGSSNVPVIDRPYSWKGGLYFDGGISDPVPFRRAFSQGCDKVVVILTRPKDYVRDPSKDEKMSKLLIKYPESAKAMATRSIVYNIQLQEAMELELRGSILILAPDDIGGMNTLTKDKDTIVKMYEKGYEDAAKVAAYIA